jgi:hypothetical protein
VSRISVPLWMLNECLNIYLTGNILSILSIDRSCENVATDL